MHWNIDLTAFLLNRDEKIGDVNFLIGPKLYEAAASHEWLDPKLDNYRPTVQRAEVCSQMTKEFHSEYLKSSAKTCERFSTCSWAKSFGRKFLAVLWWSCYTWHLESVGLRYISIVHELRKKSHTQKGSHSSFFHGSYSFFRSQSMFTVVSSRNCQILKSFRTGPSLSRRTLRSWF